METKMIRVPFDVEIAKKITNCEEKGRVVTRDGRSTRIVCYDMDNGGNKENSILALVKNQKGEFTWTYNSAGCYCNGSKSNLDLMLEIPEYMTFKDGDVIAYDSFDTISITMADITCEGRNFLAHYYVELRNGELKFNEINVRDILSVGARLANESEKHQLIGALKSSKEPKAKEYLKRFFGIEQKKEYEFKPFDKVLVRNSLEIEWIPRFFERATQCYESIRYITLDNNSWKYCIPYNENTAHLLGTTDNWEDKQ